ncbi:MAG: SpoIIE family protein phosphatase [Thermonemataceae bacterium]|nr:SpoIIE family protein phosphatase [Thermonemataceae bacterium]
MKFWLLIALLFLFSSVFAQNIDGLNTAKLLLHQLEKANNPEKITISLELFFNNNKALRNKEFVTLLIREAEKKQEKSFRNISLAVLKQEMAVFEQDTTQAVKLYKEAQNHFIEEDLPCEAYRVWLRYADELSKKGEGYKRKVENTIESVRKQAQKAKCSDLLVKLEYLAGIYLGERQKNYSLNLFYLLKALQLIEKYEVNELIQVEVFYAAGSLYYKAKDDEKALKYWLKAAYLVEKKQVESNVKLYVLLNNIGLVYRNKNDLNKALIYFKKAIEQAEKNKDSFWIDLPKGNIGDILLQNGQKDSAYVFYQRYLQAAYKVQDWGIVVAGHQKIAKYFIEKKEIQKAQIHLDSAKQLLQEKQQQIRNVNATLIPISWKIYYQQLALSYKLNKNYEKALEAQERYIAYTDSLNLLINKNQIDFLNVDFQMREDQTKRQKDEISNKQQEILSLGLFVTTFLSLLLVVSTLFNTFKLKQQSLLLKEKNKEIEAKSESLSLKNQDIMDSIHYAERIQKAFLPQNTTIEHLIGEHFTLYLPKDIVSGDFYYLTERKGLTFLVAADCTGHGVPGALMSMLGVTLLDQIIFEKAIFQPSHILQQLDLGIVHALKQQETQSQDGMDVSVCVWDKKERLLKIAGAKSNLFLVNSTHKDLIITDKIGVGGSWKKNTYENDTFSVIEKYLPESTVLYMFSDGYADQFGGENKKKFGRKRLITILEEIYTLPLKEQHTILQKTFKNWQGEEEQIDDVMILGVKL